MELRLRARLHTQQKLQVRIWLHPFLGLFLVALILGAFALMVSGHANRGEVVATLDPRGCLHSMKCVYILSFARAGQDDSNVIER